MLVRSGRSPEALAREFEPTASAIRKWVNSRSVPVTRCLVNVDGRLSTQGYSYCYCRRDFCP